MSKLEDLKQEATELGVQFSPNIGEAKLQEKINAYYESQETSSKEIAKAVEAEQGDKEDDGLSKEERREQNMRKLAIEREAEARKTVVVTLIDNDQRVNNQTTSVTVNCSNARFDLGTRILPLNVPVEVEQGFINVLKETIIPQHSKDPKTGLSQLVMRPRYTISYENIIPTGE